MKASSGDTYASGLRWIKQRERPGEELLRREWFRCFAVHEYTPRAPNRSFWSANHVFYAAAAISSR